MLEAAAAAECMQCSYEKDANTAGVSPSCRAARKHSRRSGSDTPLTLTLALSRSLALPLAQALTLSRIGCALRHGGLHSGL